MPLYRLPRYQVYIPHVPPYRTVLPILPFFFYTTCPPLYTLSPYHHILSISLIHHVSLAFTYYSILPYHTLPYPTLNYFTLPLLKLDRNDSWRKRLVLLGQIDLPSGDKPTQLGGSDSWPKIYRLFVVLVTRDFCFRPGAPDVSTFQHQGDSVPNL